MSSNYYHDILVTQGFELLGSIHYDLDFLLWWNPNLRVEVSLVELDSLVLLRATKHYRLRAWGQNGELYSRDLEQFHEFLATHLDELHMTFSSVRDLTLSLARRQIQERKFRNLQDNKDISDDTLAEDINEKSGEFSNEKMLLQRDEDLLQLDRGRSPTLQRYLQGQISRRRQRLEQIRIQAKTINEQLAVQKHLENEYIHKGEAVCLLFSSCSNVQFVMKQEEFEDALDSIITEIQNTHTYQIKQKLQGGKLNIYVDEIDAPGVSLVTRWAGAALNPRELTKLNPEFADVCKHFEEDYMVFVRKDILLNNAVQEEKKLVGARVVRNFLKRLEIVPAAPTTSVPVIESKKPIWVGTLIDDRGQLTIPWELPLQKIGHVCITGATGSGKSYLARVLVEGWVLYENLSIIILDPRGQWTGLLCPEDRPEILARYNSFGLKPNQARSFNFSYHGIGQNLGIALPEDLQQLASGHRIISFKGLDNEARFIQSSRILEAIFDACSRSEASEMKVVVLIEEAPNFLKRSSDVETRQAAGMVESTIDKIAREGRKYGISLVFLSQSIKDFSHNIACVRQNITTRIFMRNCDRELDFAADFLPDSKAIVQLPSGEAFFCNPELGTIKIAVRPPLSKVWEPDYHETKAIVGPMHQQRPYLSPEAQQCFDVAIEEHVQTGKPVKVASIMSKLGITSRRRVVQIVEELKQTSLARFEQLNERGQPLVMIPSNA